MPKSNQLANVAWILAALIFAAALVWMVVEPPKANESLVTFPRGQMQIRHADGSMTAFDVEIATSFAQQERGLMFRQKLAPDAGMIFVWPEDQQVNMWMKNTEIPLDMLFAVADGTITKIIANAAPYDLTILSSDQPVRMVVEIGGGQAAKQNVKIGDKILADALPD